jgi:hypothetical protein
MRPRRQLINQTVADMLNAWESRKSRRPGAP